MTDEEMREMLKDPAVREFARNNITEQIAVRQRVLDTINSYEPPRYRRIRWSRANRRWQETKVKINAQP